MIQAGKEAENVNKNTSIVFLINPTLTTRYDATVNNYKPQNEQQAHAKIRL